MENRMVLRGSFIQPDLIMAWTENDYDQHFKNYKQLGFDHIILQWCEYKDKSTGERYTYYPSGIVKNKFKKDLLSNLLKYGTKHGIGIYIGLNINDEWWQMITRTPRIFDQWLNTETDTSILLIDDIWKTYKNESSIKALEGWYIALEADNINFDSVEKQNILSKHYKRILNHAHTNTRLPVMISPFFNRALKKVFQPHKWRNMWINILQQFPVDILALQDGIGCIRLPNLFEDNERKKAIKDVGIWFKETRKAIKIAGTATELWSDLETFTEKTIFGKTRFEPAPLERIIKQINAEKKYVKKFTSFSFQAYQDYDKNTEIIINIIKGGLRNESGQVYIQSGR